MDERKEWERDKDYLIKVQDLCVEILEHNDDPRRELINTNDVVLDIESILQKYWDNEPLEVTIDEKDTPTEPDITPEDA